MTSVPDECHIGTRRIESPAAALFDVDGTLVDSMGRFFPSWNEAGADYGLSMTCLLYTSPSPRDQRGSRMPSSA